MKKGKEKKARPPLNNNQCPFCVLPLTTIYEEWKDKKKKSKRKNILI